MTRSRSKRYRRSAPRKPTSVERAAASADERKADSPATPAAAPRGGLASFVYRVVRLPLRLFATALKPIAQILFSVLFLIQHPQLKWLLRLVMRSRLVRDYIRPALQGVIDGLYRPYFTFLRSLPPIPATLSIAIPLAVLEPAKLYATILVLEHPKTGITLLLFLHAISFVLIDATWTAVRPQSRKIWLVSRLHALIWLNVAYGKYWVTNSASYRVMQRGLAEAGQTMRALLARLHGGRDAKHRPSAGSNDPSV
jgi:hypothetical protein